MLSGSGYEFNEFPVVTKCPLVRSVSRPFPKCKQIHIASNRKRDREESYLLEVPTVLLAHRNIPQTEQGSHYKTTRQPPTVKINILDRDSVHNLSVKLSPFLRSHSNCPGWKVAVLSTPTSLWWGLPLDLLNMYLLWNLDCLSMSM